MNSLLAQIIIPADPNPVPGDTTPGGSNYLGDMLKVQNGVGVMARFSNIGQFLNLLLPVAFIIAGIILLFLLIGGGFSIVASGGNAKSVETGKNQIMGAVIGFLVIFAAYWIIQIIEKFTGVPILSGSGL